MLHKSSFFLLFAVLICGQIASAQIKQNGKCPDVKLMKQFDWNAFDGVWYLHSKYQSDSEPGEHCVHSTFTNISVDTVGVIISGINEPNTPYLLKVTGKTMGPGVFIVTYENGTKKTDQILGTDYKSYAVMYSCDNVGAQHEERVWILTRKRNANAKTVAKAEAVLKRNCISTKFLTDIRQKDCLA